MGSYDVAQICLNGHVINSSFNEYPQFRQKFCDRCGEATTTQCTRCNESIRGSYRSPGLIGGEYWSPAFCHNCGTPFPWTDARLEAAKEFASTFDELDDAEKGELQQTLDDLTRDTPRAKVAESKFKKLIKKAGADAYDGMRSILVDVVSETVKKSLFGA